MNFYEKILLELTEGRGEDGEQEEEKQETLFSVMLS